MAVNSFSDSQSTRMYMMAKNIEGTAKQVKKNKNAIDELKDRVDDLEPVIKLKENRHSFALGAVLLLAGGLLGYHTAPLSCSSDSIFRDCLASLPSTATNTLISMGTSGLAMAYGTYEIAKSILNPFNREEFLTAQRKAAEAKRAEDDRRQAESEARIKEETQKQIKESEDRMRAESEAREKARQHEIDVQRRNYEGAVTVMSGIAGTCAGAALTGVVGVGLPILAPAGALVGLVVGAFTSVGLSNKK